MRIRDSESAGVRQNIYHSRPVVTVNLNLVDIEHLTTFKYLGSTFDAEGGSARDSKTVSD